MGLAVGMSNSKQFTPTPEQVEWLRRNYKKISYRKMASHIGTCVDTMKRTLVRYDIAHFEAEKFAVSKPVRPHPTWTRPCMVCKDETPRPKGKYICNSCKDTMNWEDND